MTEISHREVDLSVPMTRLPLWVWGLHIVLIILPMLLYAQVHGLGSLAPMFSPLLLPICAVLIVAHELVHAIGWKFASGLSWSQFKFGFIWKALTPYCHAKAPMFVPAYRFGAALPLFVTGILPFALGLWRADVVLALAGAFLIAGAAGDLFVLWTVRNVPDDAQLVDHPTQAGCIALLKA